MHELEFCSSFQPKQCRIFGIALDNYAIGHEMAMIRQGNPLATYSLESFEEFSGEAKRLALGMALEICGKVGKFRQWLLAVQMVRAGDKTLAEAIQAFRDYRASGSLDLPTKKQPRQSSSVPFHYFGAPEIARLLNYVSKHHEMMIHTHFDGSPINFPLGLAQILYSTHLESEGAIWVKNFQDMEREAPRKPGTPPPGASERVYAGDEADKVFAEAAAAAMKGTK